MKMNESLNGKHEAKDSESKKTSGWKADIAEPFKKLESKSIQEVETIARNALNEAGKQIMALAKKTEAFVRKHPVTTVATLAVIGVTVIALIRRAPNHESGNHVV